MLFSVSSTACETTGHACGAHHLAESGHYERVVGRVSTIVRIRREQGTLEHTEMNGLR
jgi:hypothetical protein